MVDKATATRLYATAGIRPNSAVYSNCSPGAMLSPKYSDYARMLVDSRAYMCPSHLTPEEKLWYCMSDRDTEKLDAPATVKVRIITPRVTVDALIGLRIANSSDQEILQDLLRLSMAHFSTPGNFPGISLKGFIHSTTSDPRGQQAEPVTADCIIKARERSQILTIYPHQ